MLGTIKTLAGFCRKCKQSNKKLIFGTIFQFLEQSAFVIVLFFHVLEHCDPAWFCCIRKKGLKIPNTFVQMALAQEA